MTSIFINVVSMIVFSIIGIAFYLVLLYIRRPGKNTERKHVFIRTLSIQPESEYNYNLSKIDMVVSEVDYGVKVWHCNEDIKQHSELQSIYNELVESYSGSPKKIIDKMEDENILPPKQNIFKRIKTFIYLWWQFKNNEKDCYYEYFKLCSLFY